MSNNCFNVSCDLLDLRYLRRLKIISKGYDIESRFFTNGSIYSYLLS